MVNEKYMAFVINMLITNTCVSPKYRIGGLKNHTICPKSTPRNTNQASPAIKLKDDNDKYENYEDIEL